MDEKKMNGCLIKQSFFCWLRPMVKNFGKNQRWE